ncbi:fluoride efflux transporter CrcB [Rodentibacter heidelbergensis]|uniref:Fluoride-specific ion channel FluC n=1 Tax=Rodentibacter heidelbergensis TaxID=1908258 RepID=A0A1V3I6J8_9PAST|nr:fluoride efflux transporter CrcB [Rodentibacter heidelbergensis]OOF35608.1 chromosome condensation protein CrcB [Rodentibacter heidelbergensis]
MLQAILCISFGAVFGALGRWGLTYSLNSVFSAFALGTLLANLIGCFLIGILMAFFWQYPQVNALWKLFLVTGFLGAFTTFSSFSMEVIELLMSDKWFNAFGVIVFHLIGGLISTTLGILLYKLLFRV